MLKSSLALASTLAARAARSSTGRSGRRRRSVRPLWQLGLPTDPRSEPGMPIGSIARQRRRRWWRASTKWMRCPASASLRRDNRREAVQQAGSPCAARPDALPAYGGMSPSSACVAGSPRVPEFVVVRHRRARAGRAPKIEARSAGRAGSWLTRTPLTPHLRRRMMARGKEKPTRRFTRACPARHLRHRSRGRGKARRVGDLERLGGVLVLHDLGHDRLAGAVEHARGSRSGTSAIRAAWST